MVDTSLNIMVKLRLDEAKKDLNALRNAFNTLAQSDMGSDTKKYQMLRKNLQIEQQMRSELGANHEVYKQTVATSKKLGASLNVNAKQMNNIRHATKGFNMDFLTLIFAGMWLKQTFGGFFNMIINDYKRVMGMNSMFTKGVLKLQASFGYLKFAIGNALNSPGIVKMIEKISNAIVWLGDWMSEHPGFAQALLIIAGALGAIGAFSMVAGGIEQVKMLFGLLGLSSTTTAIANLEKLAGLGAIIFSAKIMWGQFTSDGEWDIEHSLMTALGLGLGAFGTTLLLKQGLLTALKSGLAIATLAAIIGVGIKLILDSNKTIENAKTLDPGWSKVGKLLIGAAQGILGFLLIGSGIGFAIGGPAGALVGGLIGVITGSVGVILKMVWGGIDTFDLKDKRNIPGMDTDLHTEISNFTKQPAFAIDELEGLGGITDTFSDMQWELAETNKELQSYNDYIYDTGEKINVVNLDASALVDNQGQFNTLISDANGILPTFNTNLENSIDKLIKQADAANRAASAQERLNRAMSNRSSSSSSSVSTTTKASSIFRSSIFRND